MNRYFIGVLPNNNMAQIYNIIVGTPETQRSNNINNKVVVKLPLGDNTNHAVLNSFQEYTHEQVLVELLKLEWNDI
jgi:hypothetical protein